MQHLEVSGALRPVCGSLVVKRLNNTIPCWPDDGRVTAETWNSVAIPCWPDDGRVKAETCSQM